MQPNVTRAQPADFDWISKVVDDWWGRPVAHAIPRLFLDHFWSTSFVVRRSDTPVAFLIAFMSPSEPEQTYIHFVGVDPGARGLGIGRDLYNRFFDMCRNDGRLLVKCITAPHNKESIEFHRRMGFDVSEPVDNYNSAGVAHVVFAKRLKQAN